MLQEFRSVLIRSLPAVAGNPRLKEDEIEEDRRTEKKGGRTVSDLAAPDLSMAAVSGANCKKLSR